MIALKVHELLTTDAQVKPEGEAGAPENSSKPEEVKEERLEQQQMRDIRLSEDFCRPYTASVLGLECDSPRPQMADVAAKSDSSIQHWKSEGKHSDTLDTQEHQEQSNVDSGEKDLLGVHEPEVTDNCYQIENMKLILDLFGTSLDQGWKKASHVQLYLRAQAQAHLDELQKVLLLLTTETEIHHIKNINMALERDNNRLEQENMKLSEELNDSQSMCDRLQQKIRDLELEKTSNSAENMITSLREDLQKEKEHLTDVHKKVSELTHELDCKEAQLVAEREEASDEILVLRTQVNEAQEYKKKFQILLSSKEEEMVRVKNMNVYLKGQNSLLEQRLEKVSKEKAALQAQVQEAQASAMQLQSLLSSVEAEVRQVKDANLELERHNTLLGQENLELLKELNQVKSKEESTEERFQHLVHECECLQNTIRELKSGQADNSTTSSIITRLEEDLQTERAQLTAANKKVSDMMQEFHHKETELREKLEMVSQEKVALQAQVREAQAPAMKLQKTQSLLSLVEAEVRQVKDANLELERHNTLLGQENLELLKELNQVKSKEESTEERFQHLVHECECLQNTIRELKSGQADNSTTSSIITRLEEDLQTERAQLTAANKKVSDMMQEFHHKETELREKLEKVSKEKLDLQAQVREAQASAMKLQKTQSLLSSVEAEVRQVKDANLKLETQNNLLGQENLELSKELNQIKTKEESTEERFQHLVHECECLQNKYRELELGQADNSTNSSIITGLEEEVHEDQTSAVELQKTQSLLSSMESEVQQVKEMNLELKTQNALLEQENLEISKELHQVKTKEDSTEESFLLRQLNNRLINKEVECKKTKEDLTNIQQANEKMKEELCCSLLECNRLSQKYNEDQIKLETMLCQAEHKYIKETARLKSIIQKLEKEVNMLTLVISEEKDRFLE